MGACIDGLQMLLVSIGQIQFYLPQTAVQEFLGLRACSASVPMQKVKPQPNQLHSNGNQIDPNLIDVKVDSIDATCVFSTAAACFSEASPNLLLHAADIPVTNHTLFIVTVADRRV